VKYQPPAHIYRCFIDINPAHPALLKINNRRRASQEPGDKQTQMRFMTDQDEASFHRLLPQERAQQGDIGVGEQGIRDCNFIFRIHFARDDVCGFQGPRKRACKNVVRGLYHPRDPFRGFFHLPDTLFRQGPIIAGIPGRASRISDSMPDKVNVHPIIPSE
jgi:hypothetical protein